MNQAWDTAHVALAAAGLGACGLAAWLGWRAGYRSALLPFGLAFALIFLGFSIHKDYGITAPWWVQEAYTLGIAVALLTLAALFLLRTHEWRAGEDVSREGRRLVQSAIVLGAVAVITGVLLGALAYVRSRDILMQDVASDTRALAHSLEAHLDPRAPRRVLMDELLDYWRKESLRFPDTYFYVLGPGARVELHAGGPDRVGRSLADLPLDTGIPRVDTVGHLLARKADWVGPFRSIDGEDTIAAFSYSPLLGGLVVVEVPLQAAREDVQRVLMPWVVAFPVLVVLLPLAMALLLRAVLVSRRAVLRAERALKQTESRLQTVVQHSPVHVWVMEQDRRYSLSEGRALEAAGVAPGEAVGHTLDEVFGDSPSVRANHDRAFAGEAFSGPAMLKGRLFESWYQPFRDASGEVVRILGVSIDVTDRLQAEEALKSTLAKLQALFENSMDGIFLLDMGTGVVDLNPAGCAILGLSREEIVGRKVRDLVELQIADRRSLYLRLLRGGEAEGEISFRRRDGSAPTLEYRARANILPGLHLAVIRDITERRLLEERLERSRRLESLGVLAGGVAHDFNNLLMTILGSAELALDGVKPGDRARLELERIVTTGRRASELTEQMLTYSGRARPSLRPVRLDDAVAETVHLMSPLVPDQVTVTQEHASDQPFVHGDPVQLRQVVLNLVTNALEAVGDGPGEVQIRTAAFRISAPQRARFDFAEGAVDGPGVLLEVRDTGAGMTDDVRRKIFEPFFSTKFAGRGLGLAATLGVIRGHGGGIRVESAPGQGALFQVLLPAAAAPAAPAEPTCGPACDRACVLVADDEEGLLQLLKDALVRQGFEVLTARDGREALEVFRCTARLQAVVMDVKMPGQGGLETCRAMRALRPDVPIALSTGYSEVDTDREAMEIGAVAVLHKPFRVGALVKVLREALGRDGNRP